ncbi:MAG: phosphodiester glycosidase family protein [Oscillospiraceae bacterium]|nr:phosphodiester glycosidase family protein [Oscillospiraceae bacterium]
MENKAKQKGTGTQKGTRPLSIVLSVFLLLAVLFGLWAAAVYSSIPFVRRWRDIYIETAMSTMNHQWLATAFIPASVIDTVESGRDAFMENNRVEQSEISEQFRETSALPDASTMDALTYLGEVFPWLDLDSIPQDYLPDDVSTYQEKDMESAGICTTAGDAVWAIDVPNGILILKVYGDSYVGTLAIVNDSSRVLLGRTSSDYRGETVIEMCENYDAILGINAGGFYDPGGEGTGVDPDGLVLSEGVVYNPATTENYFQIGGFDCDDNFRVGYALDISTLRDATQFFPIIVLNGEDATVGETVGLGIQPRTAIGQSATGQTLMLVVDGRQIGYSLGTTVVECASILLRYDCYNAMCMDGGSSSSMVYDGELITKPSTPMTDGRYIPSSWLVKE